MTVNFRAVFKENYMLEFTSMDEFSPGRQAMVRTIDAFLNRVGEMQKSKWKSAGKKNNFIRTLL
jgi:hypothetical protein